MSTSASSSTPPNSGTEDAGVTRSQTPVTQQPGPRLFFAGLLFASFSAFSTRRALARRRLPLSQTTVAPQASPNTTVRSQATSQTNVLTKSPPTSHPSPSSTPAAGEGAQLDIQNNSTLMALEALSLATINVLSWGMVALGAGLWRWDVRSTDEMRRIIRGSMGMDPRMSDKQAEEDMEEWMVSVLARREEKERVREVVRGREDGMKTGEAEKKAGDGWWGWKFW